MPVRNSDLHGSAPDAADVVLLLIDVINDLDFPEGKQLFKHALPMAKNIAALKKRAQEEGIPVLYINDNFGRWQSDFSRVVEHCMEDHMLGKPMVELLLPDDEDYIVIKPKHSGFFSTTLDILLQYLRASTLILTGVAGNICVLFTANDAYMRDFNLVIPSDCVASNTSEENKYALEQMRDILRADIGPSTELDLTKLKRDARHARRVGDHAKIEGEVPAKQ